MKDAPRTNRLWYDYANKRDSEQRRVLVLDANKTDELFCRIREIERDLMRVSKSLKGIKKAVRATMRTYV